MLTGSRSGDPPADASNRLYKNNRDGTFTDVTEKAGLFRTGYWYGVTIGDYDNDGFEDLFITGWPQNALYHNNGNGTFTDVTKEAGLLNAEARVRLRLHVCRLRSRRQTRSVCLELCPIRSEIDSSRRRHLELQLHEKVFCGPRGLPYGRHSLYRNNGDGTFRDVTAASASARRVGGYGLTAVAADFDNDGWPDIYVACDSTPSLLFRNQHDGTFTEQAMERGVALSEDGMEQAGMGVGIGDFDLRRQSRYRENSLRRGHSGRLPQQRQGRFRDDTLRSGLGVETRFISWGVGIEDLDNDGNPDIFWVTGGIYPELQKQARSALPRRRAWCFATWATDASRS